VISHADLDHCNNVPALLKGGPVRSLLIGRSFLNFEKRVVGETCDAARNAGVPIRLIAAGDKLRFGSDVGIEVLHPPDRPPGDDDNANSIVLRIEFAGRSLLLTGDLEGSGQEEVMLQEPSGNYDVVAAPHHGGLKANTPRFSQWANPRSVVVSCSGRVNAAALERIYENSDLYLTSRQGALTISFLADGTVSVAGSLDGRQESPADRQAPRD
jgi:competence protein ComEC